MTPLLVVCGSVSDEPRLHAAAKPWILAGHRVHVPAANPLLTPERHDADHRRWLDSADEVIVVRKPDGSLGESATSELAYARSLRKLIHWYYPEGGEVPAPCEQCRETAPWPCPAHDTAAPLVPAQVSAFNPEPFTWTEEGGRG